MDFRAMRAMVRENGRTTPGIRTLVKPAKVAIFPSMFRFLETWRERFSRDPSWVFFQCFVFLAMVSMPLARIALVLSLVALLWRPDSRRFLRITPPAAGWLAYLAVAVVVSAVAAWFNADPALVPRKGLEKLPKLLWFVAIPVAAANIKTPGRFRATVAAVVAGGVAFSVYVLFFHTSYAWLQFNYPKAEAGLDAPVAAKFIYQAAGRLGLRDFVSHGLASDTWDSWGGHPPSFSIALTFNETLHGAQRLMVALLAAAALFLAGGAGRRRPVVTGIVLVSIATALVVTCKRGPLVAAIAATALLLASVAKPWKALAATLFLVVLALAIPQSRERIAKIPTEFQAEAGGRAMMWVEIAPALHREHPWGIGFRALTPRKMQSINRHVEPNRTHLHCTPLQAFVDFSWLGLGVWLAWTVLSLHSALRTAAGPPGTPASELPTPLRFFPLAGLVALLGVSLVEYNIADAAVVLLYGIVLGLAAPAFARRPAASSGGSGL